MLRVAFTRGRLTKYNKNLRWLWMNSKRETFLIYQKHEVPSNLSHFRVVLADFSRGSIERVFVGGKSARLF